MALMYRAKRGPGPAGPPEAKNRGISTPNPFAGKFLVSHMKVYLWLNFKFIRSCFCSWIRHEMPKPSNRSRGYCFTWNNWTDEAIATLDSLEARYLIYGKETAPDTGTPHLQGYVYWENGKSFSAARKKLRGAHVSVALGTPLQNRTYCSKGGDFVEHGVLPASPEECGRNEIDRWNRARDAAKSGDFESIDADIYMRCYSTIRRIFVDYMPRPDPLEGTCGVWIYGESGCGKTRAVLSKWPGCYIKPRNTWWDGYQREDVVLCDDVDRFDVRLGGILKHWADFAPFIGEVKGSALRIRPKKFIVTSQYKIEDIWEDEETRAALLRRFVVIHKEKGQDIILE